MSDGFWTEFFILRPDLHALRQMLDRLGSGDGLLQHEARTRELFGHAVAAIRAARAPANMHALDVRDMVEAVPCFLSRMEAEQLISRP